jgi:pyruvate ferredoxin oxidoreductase beta subunit
MDKINGLPKEEFFASGHRACAGCAEPIAIRYALKAAGKNTIVVNATGCSEVFSTPYPETSWKLPWIHGAFENAASIASGINRALKMQGRRDKTNILVFGGDGATFDIGFQFISGAFERKEQLVYICLDNEAYMNTGIQRSGSTDKFASTTTSPAGKKIHGKQEFKKPLPTIFAAHGAYVATANVAFLQDYFKKVEKALSIKGPSYIQVFTPCPTGWKYPSNQTIEIAKLAYETRVAPLYEIENGVLTFTKKPSGEKPVSEYLKIQARYKHMTEAEIAEYQKYIDEEWNRLLQFEATKVRI